MELGEVYKEDGQISFEKLFYFHFRSIANHYHFYDVDGAKMADFISDGFKRYIKEEHEHKCLALDVKKEIIDEKTVILFTNEIITGNGYCFTYYYSGNKRVLDDAYLETLALKYTNNDVEL